MKVSGESHRASVVHSLALVATNQKSCELAKIRWLRAPASGGCLWARTVLSIGRPLAGARSYELEELRTREDQVATSASEWGCLWARTVLSVSRPLAGARSYKSP